MKVCGKTYFLERMSVLLMYLYMSSSTNALMYATILLMVALST